METPVTKMKFVSRDQPQQLRAAVYLLYLTSFIWLALMFPHHNPDRLVFVPLLLLSAASAIGTANSSRIAYRLGLWLTGFLFFALPLFIGTQTLFVVFFEAVTFALLIGRPSRTYVATNFH